MFQEHAYDPCMFQETSTSVELEWFYTYAQSGMHTVFIPHQLKNHNYHVATSVFVYLIY